MEWWSPTAAGLIGGIGGTALGLCGAVIGTLGGRWAPRGEHRGLVMGLMAAAAAVGGVLLVAGLTAVFTGQRYHVWYPLVLLGGITTLVVGPLIPVFRARYRQAEQRRLGAEEFRRGSTGDAAN